MTRTATSKSSRPALALVGAATMLLSGLAVSSASVAATEHATEADITSIEFTEDTIQNGSMAQLRLAWALPDNPETPAGFIVSLPEELQGREAQFPLTDPAGVTLAQCQVNATEMHCDFDDAYLAANPRDLSGDAFFWVRVEASVEEETVRTFDFDGVEASIIVTPQQGVEFDGTNNGKWGVYNSGGTLEDGTVVPATTEWGVSIEAPFEGMAGGLEVTVVDTIGPGQTLTDAYVLATNQVTDDGLTGWFRLGDDERTVSPDLTTVTFTTQEGYFYEVRYDSEVVDPETEQETYTNSATIEVAGSTVIQVGTEVETFGGGGSGSGTDIGTFSISKEVVGAADAVPADLVFTGDYVVTTPDGETETQSFEVLAGETWQSPDYPRGSTVVLSEEHPIGPEHLTWEEPVFSENDLVLSSGDNIDVLLTNEVSLKTGVFTVAKAVVGDAADAVPADSEFTVQYSYPAGDGFDAGEGQLVVLADGEPVTSPQLPHGAEVTLTEIVPADSIDVTWGEPDFSLGSFTIDSQTPVEIELTNEVTTVPTPTPTPSATPTPTPTPSETPTPTPSATPTPNETISVGAVVPPGSPSLPSTGAEVSPAVLIGAVALMLGGTALVLVRRRQTH